MKNALVTGGCGFLGSWIVRELVDRGVSVRVLALPGETRKNLEGLDVEVVEGNVLGVADCQAAVDGMDTVFHAAAIFQDWAPNPTAMYDVNMRGTFHIIEASRRAGVEKIIYTASIVSLGRPTNGELATESSAYEAWDLDFPYSRSKHMSREIAEYFAQWGTDVRVVCPGMVLGPGDIRPTPSGEVIVTALMGGPRIGLTGGAGFVDVRDAAKIHVLAAEKGRAGERYVAVGHNLTNGDFAALVDRVAGRRRPAVNLPPRVARGIAIAMEEAAKVTGKPPLLARDFFEYSQRPCFFSSQKAINELGATFRPIEETVADAIAYFRAEGRV